MGSEETATQRLNFAQAFNPIGAVTGTVVAWLFVQNRLDPTDIVAIRLTKMPKKGDSASKKSLGKALSELIRVKNYREGVIAQFFYVGAQVVCWTFIMHYGHRVFHVLGGMSEHEADQLSFRYYVGALVLFTLGRFICTYFMRFISAGKLLMILAILAISALMGVIFLDNIYGLYCLVAVSGCMSLMFPTIYGIALRGLGDNVKFGGAGLIMSILGGSVVPPLQAKIIDHGGEIMGLPSICVSFIVPVICFAVIAIYGFRSFKRMAA